MTYELKINNVSYYYDVTYDEDKLREILEELYNYNYEKICQGKLSGDIVKFPATKRSIQKKVIEAFNIEKKHSGDTLYPDTIVHHKNKGSNYITFDYSYNKLPDLYQYIDMIVNKTPVMKNKRLFRKITDDMFYAFTHFDQIVIDELLNYANSSELEKNYENKNSDYDYIGLNKLYKETLKCLSFNLIAVKEYVESKEVMDGISLQRKKR